MAATNPHDLRWRQLAAELSTALGVEITVSCRPGPAGALFIAHNLPSGDRFEVHDAWWRKNHDVWTGYQIHVENRDSIVTRTWPTTKARAEVVAAAAGAVLAAAT